MMIYLGADHGGFWLKENTKQWLKDWGYEFIDMGAKALEPEDDHPIYAFAVAKAVAENPGDVGILFCRSGGGMAIAANRVKGVRAVEVYDIRSTQHAKTNNNANIITLGANWLSEEQASTIIKTWLVTTFNNEPRYVQRIAEYDSSDLA